MLASNIHVVCFGKLHEQYNCTVIDILQTDTFAFVTKITSVPSEELGVKE